MSSVDLPSIQTNFAPYSSSPSSAPRPYRSASPGSPAPTMTFQNRSYSTSSASSLLSTYSSSSDRSLSVSPGPATPCDVMSRSPSFSHDSIYKPTLPSLQHKHPYFSPSAYASHPSSPSLSSHHRYTSSSSITSRHHPYQPSSHHHQQQQQQEQQPKHYYPPSFQDRPFPSQHPSSALTAFRALSSPSSPRDMFSSPSSRNHGDHHPSLHHHQHHQHQHQVYQPRSPYSSGSNHQADYFQARSPTKSMPHSFNSAFTYHTVHPMMATPKEEEQESFSLIMRSVTPPPAVSMSRSTSGLDLRAPTAAPSPHPADEDDDRSDYAPSMSHSPTLSHAGSSFSRESSPSSMMSDRLGSMSEASASMASLLSSSSSSSSSSMTPVPTTTQLLLCPVCSRAFKPSKNQNCNLRRHLKNVHNMSPTMHPRKCKWDSLPDGRVKDDKDRKERTRKSKRLWARKFRQRRKVEEAAVVLSMLSQAV